MVEGAVVGADMVVEETWVRAVSVNIVHPMTMAQLVMAIAIIFTARSSHLGLQPSHPGLCVPISSAICLIGTYRDR